MSRGAQCHQRGERDEPQHTGKHKRGGAHMVDREGEQERGPGLDETGRCHQQSLTPPIPHRPEDGEGERPVGDGENAVAGAVQQGKCGCGRCAGGQYDGGAQGVG